MGIQGFYSIEPFGGLKGMLPRECKYLIIKECGPKRIVAIRYLDPLGCTPGYERTNSGQMHRKLYEGPRTATGNGLAFRRS